MNKFYSTDHEALVRHLFGLTEKDAYDAVPHMAHADYLEEQGYPLYAEVVKQHIKQNQEDAMPLVYPAVITSKLSPHSHQAYASDTTVSPDGRNIIDITRNQEGKKATTVNYDLNGTYNDLPHTGVSYSGHIPLTSIIKHGMAQQEIHPTEEVKELLGKLSHQVPLLYDNVEKNAHKYAKEYEQGLRNIKG